ncbi:MAG: hypothetical protein R3D00_23705 [Bacteroidia bacterium]
MHDTVQVSDIQSRMGVALIVVTSIFALIFAGMVWLIFSQRNDLISYWHLITIGLAAPVLALLGLWKDDYSIHIQRGRVQLKGLFGQKEFMFEQISGFAFTYVSMPQGGKMETMYVGLKDGRFFRLNPLNFRNYPDLRDAFKVGILPDPVLAAKAIKDLRWQQFLTISGIFVLTLLFLAPTLTFQLSAPEISGLLPAEADTVESLSAGYEAAQNRNRLYSLGSVFLIVIWAYWRYARLTGQPVRPPA